VFDDGNKRVVLVGLDLLFITRHLVKEIREEIQKRCGIEPQNIMIGASHSHSSGPIAMSEPGDFDHASDLIKYLAENQTITSEPGFTQYLKEQTVMAVVRADITKKDAKLAVGSGHEDKVSFNRRLRMKNGLSYSHPGV